MAVEELNSDLLKFKNPNILSTLNSTADVKDPEGPIGQERVVEVLRFGTQIGCAGYSIYVLGPAGIGKHQIVQQFLQNKISNAELPSDWVYVNNFADEGQPLAIGFPAGEAKEFQKQVHQLIDDLRSSIPTIYESERYRNQRDSIIREVKEKQDQALAELQDRAKRENIYLLNIHGGLVFSYGDKQGNILDDEAIAKLPKKEQESIYAKISKYNEALIDWINRLPIQDRQVRKKIKELNKEMVSRSVKTLAEDIRNRYAQNSKVTSFLEKMVNDIIDNAGAFRRRQDDHPDSRELPTPLRRYEVNVIVDHAEKKQVPVVYEDNPTFMNLVGQVEHISEMGALITNYTMIRSGALHRANGGYLVIDAQKLLSSPYAYEGLKRALRAEQIKIESLGQVYSLTTTVTLKPEPIPLRCKVILIGDPELYQLLVKFDPDFKDLFRVSADFESDIQRSEESESKFIQLISYLVKQDHLQPIDSTGLARVMEYASRISSDNERLSINIGLLSNLLREADFYAHEANKKLISAEDVQRALDGQAKQASRVYEQLINETTRGVILIDVTGAAVGQVNGLSIFEFGNQIFGHTSRITAAVRMGDAGIIDIEREVKMGGPIHSKGVLILSGFLKAKFAPSVPLSLSASLVFEQSYGFIDGDSASLAELAALLSSLSQYPIKQSLAITGSVNQHGVAQPVGGINQKIEGFFDLCKSKGLNSEQGVIIPRANLKHLVLRSDVIDAIKNKLFHLYAVDNIDDCIHLLTGMPVQIIYEKINRQLLLFQQQQLLAKKTPVNQLELFNRPVERAKEH